MITDKDRLDYLESLVVGYGEGVVLRKRTFTGALALHECSDASAFETTAHATVREAIDAAIKESA